MRALVVFVELDIITISPSGVNLYLSQHSAQLLLQQPLMWKMLALCWTFQSASMRSMQ